VNLGTPTRGIGVWNRERGTVSALLGRQKTKEVGKKKTGTTISRGDHPVQG